MTVIAWDGRYLVTDAQADSSGHKFRVRKMELAPTFKGAFATSGQIGHFPILMNWYVNFHGDYEKRPDHQKGDDWSRLVIVENGKLKWYENAGVNYFVGDFMAFGSGRDFAIGAMEVGATAVQAVRATIKHCVGAGLGIDVYDSQTHELKRLDL